MFVVFGARGRTSTVERGSFFCPSCGSEEEFHRKRVKRYGTLFFIPTIPLGDIGEYIECQ